MPDAAVDWVRVVKGENGVFSRRGAVFDWRDFGPVRFLGVLMRPPKSDNNSTPFLRGRRQRREEEWQIWGEECFRRNNAGYIS